MSADGRDRDRGLTKDYFVGFWRPKPYRALDRLTLAVDAGRSVRVPRPQRRGQEHDAQAAHGADLPDQRLGAHPRQADRRPRHAPPHRLPSREPVLLRLPHRRGAADATSPACPACAASARTRRVSQVLDEVGIGAERRMRLRSYSKGMIQRVGVAQALVDEPDVVFFDEPMSGLDPLGRRDLRQLMLRLRDRGCTVFFSSHILADAEALCSRVGDSRAGASGRGGAARRHRRVRAARLGAGRGQPAGGAAESLCRAACDHDDAALGRSLHAGTCADRSGTGSDRCRICAGHGVQHRLAQPDPDDARGLFRDDGADARRRGTPSGIDG